MNNFRGKHTWSDFHELCLNPSLIIPPSSRDVYSSALCRNKKWRSRHPTRLKHKDILRRGRHEIGGGETVYTYVQEMGLTEKKPGQKKIDPILVDLMELDNWSLGRRTAKPWRGRKAIKKKS